MLTVPGKSIKTPGLAESPTGLQQRARVFTTFAVFTLLCSGLPDAAVVAISSEVVPLSRLQSLVRAAENWLPWQFGFKHAIQQCKTCNFFLSDMTQT